MRAAVFFLVFLFALQGSAAADYYLKATAMGGQMQTQNWTSGKKQRTQSSYTGPDGGSPEGAAVASMSNLIIITRVDKGVEWTADPVKKIYQERPIALPYTKKSVEEEKLSGEDLKQVKSAIGGKIDGDDCTLVTREVGARTFAGHAAIGYQTACEEPQENEIPMTVWIAPAKGDIAKINKDAAEYEKERFRAQYANYPPAERKELEEGAEMMQALFKMGFDQMKGVKIPQGVPLAMESPNPEPGMSGLFYEVTELKTGSVNQAVFDLPPGYTKVEDVIREKADDMMRGMGMDPDQMRQFQAEIQQQTQGAEDTESGQDEDQ